MSNSEGDSTDAPDDRLRERAEQSRAKLWLLLDADRRLVTGAMLAVVFFALAGTGYLLPAAEAAVRGDDSIDTLFQGLLTATITGVTLVLTLNQLVLSQELGAAGDQRDRMEGAMAFRDEVAAATDQSVSPAEPSGFLRALVETAGERAEALRDAVGQSADPEVQSSVDRLTDAVVGNAESVSAALDGARFGEFDAVAAALDFNYSWKLFAGRRLRERHGDALDEAGTEALDGLVEALRLFGPAREHVKTLYFQRELIDLSRQILAAGVPALLVSIGMIAFFDASAYGVRVAGVDTLAVVVAGTVTLALVPFLILLAYILRVMTVVKHTLSIGPLILRETAADIAGDEES